MAGYTILIVDDQREVSRVLRSGLESLDADFAIKELLSGEEALLEIKSGVDLLVSDLKLPGISGMELMEKFRAQNPDIKVILISGVTDQKIRRQVAQAGADAFFFKPVELADFMDAVERALGLVETLLPNELSIESGPAEERRGVEESLSSRIANLRGELDATSVLLIGEHGQVLVRAGALPKAEIEKALMPELMAAIHAGMRVAHSMGSSNPAGVSYFNGDGYDLFLSPVGEAFALMVATRPLAVDESPKVSSAVLAAASDIAATFSGMGTLPPKQERKPATAKPQAAAGLKEPIRIDPELESILQKALKNKAKKADVEAFWAALGNEPIANQNPGGEVLSYEQALQLGLAPPEVDA